MKEIKYYNLTVEKLEENTNEYQLWEEIHLEF